MTDKFDKPVKRLIDISKNSNETMNDTYDIDIKITDTDLELNDLNDEYQDSLLIICSKAEPGIILYVNSLCKELLGFERNFLIGKSVFSFMHNEDVIRIMQDCTSKITHRLLSNFKGKDNKRYYKWFTSENKKLENIVYICSRPINLDEII